MKLQELFKSTEMPVLNVQSILCLWEDVQKSTVSMLKKLRKRVWKEDGVSPQGSTYPYSAMHGEPNDDEIDYHEHEPIVLRDLERTEKQKNQLDKAMKAKIDPSDALRKAGL